MPPIEWDDYSIHKLQHHREQVCEQVPMYVPGGTAEWGDDGLDLSPSSSAE